MFIKYSNSSEFKWKFEIGNNLAAELLPISNFPFNSEVLLYNKNQKMFLIFLLVLYNY